MYALELGTLSYCDGWVPHEKTTMKCYKVKYKNEILYIDVDDIMLSGDSLVAKDGNTYKLGEVIYHGKNHDIVISTNREFICSDGCDGNFLDSGPLLETLDDYCRYADASYTDESTGLSYPLCTSKSIYDGEYGTVYALANGEFKSTSVNNGFIVFRKNDYQKVSFDDLDEETQKFFLENGADKDSWFRWRFSANIYTLDDAKLQADSFESVKGYAVHSATFF